MKAGLGGMGRGAVAQPWQARLRCCARTPEDGMGSGGEMAVSCLCLMRPGSSRTVRREVSAGGTDLDTISTRNSFSQSGVSETGFCRQVSLESLGPPRPARQSL